MYVYEEPGTVPEFTAGNARVLQAPCTQHCTLVQLHEDAELQIKNMILHIYAY